jgi:AcrR family transcriptional regulator
MTKREKSVVAGRGGKGVVKGVGRRVGKDAAAEAAAELSVREHILDRTVFLIGRQGTTDVSVREIAREAGVNVAAVNYYFSSKDLMFTQLAGRFLAGYESVMGILRTPGVSAEKRLRDWSAVVMGYLGEYPGFLLLMERLMTAEPLDPFGEALRSAMQSALRLLRDVLEEYVGPTDEQRLAFKLTLFTSALAGPFPSLTGRAPRPPRGLKEPAARAKFVDLLLEHLRR